MPHAPHADRRRLGALWLALAAAVPPALAADEPPPIDPLALEAAPAPEAPKPKALRAFVEIGAGAAQGRDGVDDRGIGRVSLDARASGHVAPSLRAVFSARLDATDPKDARFDEAVFSLREAYFGWQDDSGRRVVEAGRINVREGPAYAYNPTDFLRAGSLRTVTAVDPATLRENRMGTVLLRGQQLWEGGSLAVAFAPRLDSAPSDRGFDADFGATNAREKFLATASWRVSEAVTLQGLAFRQAGESGQLGASASALLSPAVVAHLEWSGGRGTDLLSQATGATPAAVFRQRWAAGLGYTTGSGLTITAEVHYNGFALDRDGWRALRADSPGLAGAYLYNALARQDNASRHALFVHAMQRDLVVKGLDLTALVKDNRSDGSRLYWLELKYRMDGADVAAQVQRLSGPSLSEFGIVPYSTTVGAVWTQYF